MLKIAAAVLLAGLLNARGANAAPDALVVTLYADRAIGYIDPATGAANAFMCLAPQDEPAYRPECFGFYPRGEEITSIEFAGGGGLIRDDKGWREWPAGFRFVQTPGAADNIVLHDASRDLSMQLSVPKGGTMLTIGTKSQHWLPVMKVGFPPGAKGFIGADWAKSDYEEPAEPWNTAGVRFSKVISAKRRIDLLSIINNWNNAPNTLTTPSMVALIDAVAATVGAKRPHAIDGLTPADYVADLTRLNP